MPSIGLKLWLNYLKNYFLSRLWEFGNTEVRKKFSIINSNNLHTIGGRKLKVGEVVFKILSEFFGRS